MRFALLLPALVGFTLAAQESAYLGTWKLTTPADIPSAIDQATEGMNFVSRPLAKLRLKKLTPVYARIALVRVGGEVRVQFDQRAPICLPVDGSVAPWTREDGEAFKVSAKFNANELVQRLEGDDGVRTNVFKADPAAGTLTLEVTVESKKLPRPLTYTSVYKAE